jgi:hypothetical protein
MPQSIPNAAQPAGRLFANRSSADRPIACFFLVVRSLPARLLLTAFPWLSLIAQLSIFESHALTTSTFDPNTYLPPAREAHRTHLKTK